VDLFLACCLPFDRVDLVAHIYLISVKHHKVKISKDKECASLTIVLNLSKRKTDIDLE
jgi:hypothetical protein